MKSCASKKQVCVALSSCEAEYVALALAAQEATFMQGLLAFISCSSMVTKPTLVYGDNQGAIALTNNPVSLKRAKHIATRHHFIGDLIEAKNCNWNTPQQLSMWPTSLPRTCLSLPLCYLETNSPANISHPPTQLFTITFIHLRLLPSSFIFGSWCFNH